MRSFRIRHSIRIAASPEAVFDYTQDYTRRLDWDTFLTKAVLLNNCSTAGIGVSAYCQARNGLGMETIYISFTRPHVTAIRMTRGPYLFRRFAGSWVFKEIDAQHTEVIFTYSFELRAPFGIIGNYIKQYLSREVMQRLVDLKTCMKKRLPQ